MGTRRILAISIHPQPHTHAVGVIFCTAFKFMLCINNAKNTKGPLTFNIKVGGVNYFANDQIVANMGTVYTFPFERRYEDTVAVVFSEYSEYPGVFFIDSYDNNTYFDSSSQEFYIVNQCSTSACDLKIEAYGNWDSYWVGRNTVKPSVTLYINGEGKEIKVADDSYKTKIKKDDIIKIETVPVVYPIGLTFTMTAKGMSQGAPIEWFNLHCRHKCPN